MSLTQKLTTTTENIDLTLEVLSVLSEKTGTDMNELWSHLSDKSPDELKKSVKKPKKKRAKTAYTMFSSDQEVTKALKEKHGEDIKIGEMSKLKSEMWKNMSDEDKKVYEEKAKKKNEEEPVTVEKVKKKRDKTPYNMFLGDNDVRNEIVEKLGENTFIKVNSEMSKKWKEMSDKDKKKYVDQAKKANDKSEDTEETVKTDETVKTEETEETVKKPVKKKTTKKK